MPLDTGPSSTLYEKIFGKRKKEKFDNVRSGGSSDSPRTKKVNETDEEPEENTGVFSRLAKTKKKYNPFDRFVSATSKK